MLRFKVGPFPVLVYPWFFLSAVLLGPSIGSGWAIFAWILVVFVSVLGHELGHAIVGRLYGGRPEIRLEAFGGVTFPKVDAPLGPGRQFVLSFAGPVAGLLIGAAAYGLGELLPPAPGSVSGWMIEATVEVSKIWAIFNLLPILPLDGGQMMLALLHGARRRPSEALAAWISIAVVVLVAGAMTLVYGPRPLTLVWLGLFALQNFQRARMASAQEPAKGAPAPAGQSREDATERADVHAAMEEARNALQRRDYDAALAVAVRLDGAGGPYRQAAALRLRAGIELARGDNESAAMFAGQSYSIWQSADAAVVAARANLRAGAEDRARNWLRRALEAGASAAAVRADPELGSLG